MVEVEDISEIGEAEKVYHELLSFLSSPRDDLRKAAAEATLSSLISSTDAGAEINHETATKLARLNAIPPLCKIASSSTASGEALASLSLLCSHEQVGHQCILDFIEAGGIGRMIEIALEPFPSTKDEAKLSDWRKRVNYACALLANATREEEGVVEFVGLSFPEEAVPSSRLIGHEMKYGEGNPASDDIATDPAANLKRDAKPTAILLLSRLLNPSFIDTNSPEYKSSVKAMDSTQNDTYDSDLDENDLNEAPDNTHDLQKQKSQPAKGDEHYDPYQHMAAVLMNITQLESGRNFLMKLIHNKQSTSSTPNKDTASTSHLQMILPELNSPNIHRRRGIAGTLKNCCFAKDSDWWLLNVVHLDKALLLPLAGPEELSIDEKVGLDPDYWLLGPSKLREPDPLVRLSLVEALLLLLASGRYARETLRQRRMFVIIKMADMVEENEEISERMNECVQYLRRDEEGTEEGSSDARAYEVYARGMVERNGGWGGGKVEAAVVETEVDYDNID